MTEYIGLAGTILTLIAFTRKGEFQIRAISLVGNSIFLVYGFLIHGLSVIALNVILIGLNIYRLHRLSKGKAEVQSKYDVFLICPVRNATDEQKERMNNHIELLETKGRKVYYPARDTNQDDEYGYRICTDNYEAIRDSETVHIFWDKNSTGSLFDIGVAFALNKKVEIINVEEVEMTQGKSFSNMILLWKTKGKHK